MNRRHLLKLVQAAGLSPLLPRMALAAAPASPPQAGPHAFFDGVVRGPNAAAPVTAHVSWENDFGL